MPAAMSMPSRLLAAVGTFALFAAGMLAAPARAATESLDVEAYGPTEGYHFEFNGNDTPNPTVNVTAGDHVTIHFSVNEGALASHNFHVDTPIDQKVPCCKAANETATLDFDVPATASGSIAYFCDLHKALGMQGTFHVLSATTTGTTSGYGAKTPGFEAGLAFVAIAGAVALARRR